MLTSFITNEILPVMESFMKKVKQKITDDRDILDEEDGEKQ